MKDMKRRHSDNRTRQSLGSLAITMVAAFILTAPNAIAADGAAIYGKKCKSCHGADGTAKTKMGKKLKCRDLSDPSVQKKLSDAQIAKSITHGVKEGSKVRMKPIKGLNEADIKAVVKYVRTLKK
jgi:mono/diheme cytochrome c family protein